MKKLLVAVPVLAFSLAACSQPLPVANVPSVVQNAVKAQFADITELEWKKAGDAFEADFKQGPDEFEVRVSQVGQVLGVKKDLALTDLPAAISNAISSQFKGYTIDEVERIENNGQVYYQVELEKILREKKMVFSPEGQVAANVAYWD